MIQKIGKITLYVDDCERAKHFWVNKVGFLVALEQHVGDVNWLEITPCSLATTHFVLYDKAQMVREMPTLNVGAPSVIFTADDIAATRDRLAANGVTVGALMKLPYGSMFSFEDSDGNEFLVQEGM